MSTISLDTPSDILKHHELSHRLRQLTQPHFVIKFQRRVSLDRECVLFWNQPDSATLPLRVGIPGVKRIEGRGWRGLGSWWKGTLERERGGKQRPPGSGISTGTTPRVGKWGACDVTGRRDSAGLPASPRLMAPTKQLLCSQRLLNSHCVPLCLLLPNGIRFGGNNNQHQFIKKYIDDVINDQMLLNCHPSKLNKN